MDWIAQPAEWLRERLLQQAWLEPAQPLIERAPDWVLLSAGPLLLVLLVLAARVLSRPPKGKRDHTHPADGREATTPAMVAREGAKTRVFLSYSRKDGDFTGRLANALTMKGYVVDFDQSQHDPDNVELGISAEDEWWKRLQAMIAAADTMVFIVSADSAASKVCDEEIGYARALGKRVIPILRRPIDFSAAPPRLAALNVKLSFVDERAFDRSVNALAAALDLDIAWHREGARLAALATKWDQEGRAEAQLLPEGGVASAREWAARRPPNAPLVGELVQQFVDASDTKTQSERDRLLANIGRAYVKPAEQALAEGRYDAAQRLSAAGALLGEDLALRLVPERGRAAAMAAFGQTLRATLRHKDRVASAVFSPDGGAILTASYDGSARIWDGANGALIGELLVPSGVSSASFSADGSRVITVSADQAVRLWDRAASRQIALLQHTHPVRSAAFSPDAKRIVTASHDGAARVWDAASGREMVALRVGEYQVKGAQFSPDGARIISWATDTPFTVRVWDPEHGRAELFTLGHAQAADFAGFSPDGRRIVTTAADSVGGGGVVRLWDAASGSETSAMRGHSSAVWRAAFSPDGTKIVTASLDRTARLWNTADGREVAVLNHDGGVWWAEFSADGARVATASEDRTARLWDAANGREIAVLKGHEDIVDSAVFSPDGMRAVTASRDGAARIWDAVGGCRVGAIGVLPSSAAFSPDSARVVTTSGVSPRIHEAPSGREVNFLSGLDAIDAVAFSPDGKRVVAGSRDRTAKVVEIDGKREIAVCRGHDAEVNDAMFSPDGQRIVTASKDCTARIWNVADGRELVVLRGHKDDVRGAVFDADGQRVVTASFDHTAIIWDAMDGRQVGTLPHQHRVADAAFGPDGAIVLTSCWDGSARLWDVLQGRELKKFSEGEVRRAAFSADGGRIVTTSRDHIIRVWDAASGRQIAEVGKHEHTVGVVFSPDGKLVLTWGGTGGEGAIFWDVSRTLALCGDPIEILAASLSNGRGQRSGAERTDLLMQSAPDDLYNALIDRLTPQQRESAALRADVLLRSLHPNRYNAPSRLH